MKTCTGKTKTGAPCGAPAGPGGLCFLHENPNRAKALGRIGGLKNRRSAVDLEVPESLTAVGLCQLSGQAIRLLLAGELGAREASALAQLSNSISRILPTADLEARITMLEQQIAQEGQAAQKENGIVQRDASIGPPTEGTKGAKTSISVEAEQPQCSTDAAAVEQEERAQSVVDGSSDDQEAQS